MLFVKLLFLFAGGGVLTGVSVSNAYKGKPQTPVANNKTAKKVAKLELKLKISILSNDKNRSVAAKKRADKRLETKTADLTTAKTNLITANEDLNKEKKSLNETSSELKKKYEELETKNTDLADALKEKIKEELEQAEKALNKKFYDSQKVAYEVEKEAITAKANALKATSAATTAANICGSDNGDNWSLRDSSVTAKTAEEDAIETAIKAELLAVCKGITEATEKSTSNSASAITKKAAYDAAKTARDKITGEIGVLTNKYNSQKIEIGFKESAITHKMLLWKQKQESHKTEKEKSEKVNNELESLEEQISEQNNTWKNF